MIHFPQKNTYAHAIIFETTNVYENPLTFA